MSNLEFISHSTLMLLSFGFFMPTAVLARVYKSDNNTWYYIHIGCNSLGIILAFIGFIIGINLAEDGQFNTPHPILGLTTMSLVLLQPINAAVRPHVFKDELKSKTRIAWEWIHFVMGNLILITSSITIGLGIQYAYQLEYYNENTFWLFALLYSIYSTMVGMGIVLPQVYKLLRGSIPVKPLADIHPLG